ncbi:HAD-IA family hydrolase [Mesorhizobium sp. BAC0120]|uniref:HAD-IA family hydrolase n=1 Tax=Mesorhizobium sp. BAC0120 TaxID=3090670 RepID=UPI00298D165D|nr:HAD-IA family hydrolase [Mesorhizobium sp. BAC0120]MDW6021869.1 HAD-IA family hydrolase [Mesorhizobium sp. BAC0120]
MFPGRKFAAFLFDMDGTLLNSIAAAERVWAAWAMRHGLDVASFLPTIHGMRAIETITRLALPGVDPIREAKELAAAEIADVEGVVPIAGVTDFLASLPAKRWAIVTSSPRELALKRMAVAGIPMPHILVTGEDVTRGKPAPDCFLLAAERLGVDASDCLAFEDAPAGIAAASASGAEVVVITATHQHPLETPHAAIASYEEVRAIAREDSWIGFEPMLLAEAG